jgi:hypothetical protein
MEMIRVFLNGFMTGLVLQVALGPVFLGAAVFALSVLKASVPPSIIAYLRIPVGALLFGYGIARIAVPGRKSVSIPSGKRDDRMQVHGHYPFTVIEKHAPIACRSFQKVVGSRKSA